MDANKKLFCTFAVDFSTLNVENIIVMVENRLKVILAEKKLTSRWLADKIGKNENTVSRWCSNKVQPSLSQLEQLATILDVNIHTLISNDKNITCEEQAN